MSLVHHHQSFHLWDLDGVYQNVPQTIMQLVKKGSVTVLLLDIHIIIVYFHTHNAIQ